MMKCSECGKDLETENAPTSITGTLDGKEVTMCFTPCFRNNYKLKKPAKTNIFLEK